MSRAYCVKTIKISIFLLLVFSLISVYLLFSRLSQDKSFGNKVARVLKFVNEESLRQDDLENNNDEETLETSHDQGEEDEVDEWVEDPDNNMMDAKVMNKGQQKMIIVDLPNPKAKWIKSNHEEDDWNEQWKVYYKLQYLFYNADNKMMFYLPPLPFPLDNPIILSYLSYLSLIFNTKLNGNFNWLRKTQVEKSSSWE